MVMLVLSAAFDTLDRDFTIERLGKTHGFGPRITDRFNSYLRCQRKWLV